MEINPPLRRRKPDEKELEHLGPVAQLKELRTLTPERARRAFQLNRFLVALRLQEFRTLFQQDEEACMQRFCLTDQERDMVRNRAYREMLDYGASVVALGKAGVALGATLIERGAAECNLTAAEFLARKKAQGKENPWLDW